MSVLTLATGRLCGEPTTKPTRNGGQITFFKLRVANGGQIEFWNIATFSNTVREELSDLNEGDALAVVGEMHVELYEWRGETRVNLKLTADRILPLKPKPKKPRKERSHDEDERQDEKRRFRENILPELNDALNEGVAAGLEARNSGVAFDDDIPF